MSLKKGDKIIREILRDWVEVLIKEKVLQEG